MNSFIERATRNPFHTFTSSSKPQSPFTTPNSNSINPKTCIILSSSFLSDQMKEKKKKTTNPMFTQFHILLNRTQFNVYPSPLDSMIISQHSQFNILITPLFSHLFPTLPNQQKSKISKADIQGSNPPTPPTIEL
jgi:hypothetical protein